MKRNNWLFNVVACFVIASFLVSYFSDDYGDRAALKRWIFVSALGSSKCCYYRWNRHQKCLRVNSHCVIGRKRKAISAVKKYTVKISKEGYAVQTVTVDTKANGWYIGGNILLGGLIGWLIVDPATGAMRTLDTKEINATLAASKQGTIIEPNKSRYCSFTRCSIISAARW